MILLLNIYGGIQSDNFDVWKLAYTKSSRNLWCVRKLES